MRVSSLDIPATKLLTPDRHEDARGVPSPGAAGRSPRSAMLREQRRSCRMSAEREITNLLADHFPDIDHIKALFWFDV